MRFMPSVNTWKILFVFAFGFMVFDVFAESRHIFDIKLKKPEFILPQYSPIFSPREAAIALEEVETAVALKDLLDSGDRQKVLKELEKYYDLELSPAMLMLKAQVYFSIKEYDKAEATYLSVLERMPQLIRAHSDLGQLYLMRENFVKARQYFANAVAYGSNEALVYGQLGYLNLTLHGATSAISAYQKALMLEPENVQWQRGLLAALSQAKMYEATLAYVKELIQKRPDDPDIWLNQAALALQLDNKEMALGSLEMAILLGDVDTANLKTAAQLHLRVKSYGRASELMASIINKNQLDAGSLFDYVNWLVQSVQYDQAEKLLSLYSSKIGSLSIDEQSIYYLQSARIAQHKQQYANADALYKKSLEKNPVSGDALVSYAEFLVSRKDYVQSEFYFLRAEVLPEYEKKAMMGRAQMFIDSQNYNSAVSVLRDVFKKYPEMSDLQDTIATLENIIRNRESA
ncbi:tetratricopeptide repeat protein [Cellvibrio sp. UBA7661]|uniref:tetratricopeptide repeat protein n=1 Tax=Cellvibrio sp. UBA7661 TaxID=1946311 RepID=UPI002F360CF1